MGTQNPETFSSNMASPGVGQPQECFVLKWNDYHTNVADSFKSMRADGDFLDTTVACSGSEQLQAHRVVLAAFSPYLKGMLRNNPQPNPVLIMPPNVKFIDLHSLLEFMYHGEVRVPADHIESLMQLAQLLRVKGLTDEKELEDEHRIKNEKSHYLNGMMPISASDNSAASSTSNFVAPTKGVESKAKRKRTASTSTVASESNDEDPRLSEQSLNPYADNALRVQSMNSGSYDSLHPGGSNDDGMNGTGITLSGLICPNCRILCHGVPALKEHMAAAHGIIDTPNHTPAQTPVKAPKQPKIDHVTPVATTAWNPPSVPEPDNVEITSEPETFSCNLCPKDKSRTFTSEQKLITHQKKKHKDDIDEEDLEQLHEELSMNEDTNDIPSQLARNDSVMAAPLQRSIAPSTPSQMNKRGGKGGSNRGRSPAMGRPRKGMTQGRSDDVKGGLIDEDGIERSERRQTESPRHRQMSNTGEMFDGTSAIHQKTEGYPMVRPVGQVSPAPRNNYNSGVSKLSAGNHEKTGFKIMCILFFSCRIDIKYFSLL